MLDLPDAVRTSLALLVVTTCVLLGTVSPDLPLAGSLHQLVLLAHLAALAVGLGAVLAIDWHGLLWLLRRIELTELLTVTSRLTTPVWAGLSSLVATGVLLTPDVDAPLTRLELALVAVVTVNGLHAGAVHDARCCEPAPRCRRGCSPAAWLSGRCRSSAGGAPRPSGC